MNRTGKGIGGVPVLVAGGVLLAVAAGPTALPPPVAPDLPGIEDSIRSPDVNDTHTPGEPPRDPSQRAANPRIGEEQSMFLIEGTIERQEPGELTVRDLDGQRVELTVPEGSLAPSVQALDLQEGRAVRATYEDRGDRKVVIELEPIR